MNIRPESYTWIVGSALPTVLFYGIWVYTASYWFLGLFVLSAGLTVFFVYFFRDPDREPDFRNLPTVNNPEEHWLAPADGIVTRVDTTEDGRNRIVIFLTVFNVHVNRMPVSGTIRGIEYREGRFLPAFADNIEERNERNRIICHDNESREFEVWQIAGLLARRIHFWNDLGDQFNQGDRFGMIALGSRTDLILPGGVDPTVSVDQSIRGGETVVATG
ncbi:MAG: phosphatidylserine decarboxylase [bacterium]